MREIKDSGSRTEFISGAVRDCKDDNGRCDLLPLDVVGFYLDDCIFNYIDRYVRYGDRTAIKMALDVFAKRLDATRYDIIIDVSHHYKDGLKKYPLRNWELGIPCSSYIDSAVRHYLKYLDELDDEPHDRAFVWNLLCCLWTEEHLPEMNDLPFSKTPMVKDDETRTTYVVKRNDAPNWDITAREYDEEDLNI